MVTALVVIACLIVLAMPVAAIISSASNKKLKVEGKLGWAFGILLSGPVGAAIYYLIHGRGILVRAFNGMFLLASVAAVAILVHWWNKSGFGKTFAAIANHKAYPVPTPIGRWDLKYVTCKNPKSISARGQELNQELRQGRHAESIEFVFGKAHFSGRYTDAAGGECGIQHRHKVIDQKGRWTAEAATEKSVHPSGGFDAKQCDELAAKHQQAWTKNQIGNGSQFYLHDSAGSEYCGDSQSYHVYEKSQVTAGFGEAGSPSVRANTMMREAMLSLNEGRFDQAIAKAEEARALAPARRAPAAVIAAAQKMKQDPGNTLLKAKATSEVVEATVEDSKEALEHLKNILNR